MAKKKYYSLAVEDRQAVIDIYGDITSWPWLESDVSAYNLSKEIEGLDVDSIDVHINSYGGEVAEGLAIYNRLRQHPAHVQTFCDGFACSIASVIFMAGDDRMMADSSLLMIHNPWTYASGNAEEFRKQAEDLDKITQASTAAYLNRISIDAEELKALMDRETWITPEEALDMGFATQLTDGETEEGYSQGARKTVADMLLKSAGPEHRVPLQAEKLFATITAPSAGYGDGWTAPDQTVTAEYVSALIRDIVKEELQKATIEVKAEKAEPEQNAGYKEKLKNILNKMEVKND